MPSLFLSYIDLTPDLENPFTNVAHKSIIDVLRSHFVMWSGFLNKYPDYDIGFIVATKREITALEIKGPSISKKMKVVDFTIYLPNRSYNLSEYIDLVFDGVATSLQKYDIERKDIEIMKVKCKSDLAINDSIII
jgi:hypothetical protein